jgi:type VI secretion system protein ImpM
MSEAAVNHATAAGWFGKLPNLGDFASRRLPERFVQRWDAWLQQGLAATRGELGAAWLERYLVAPIYRFWVAPGVLDEQAWAGILMPSVDRVGRHFPLTVAQPASALEAALASLDWYRAIDAAARQVLDVQFGVDEFEQRLAAIAPPSPDAAALAVAQRLAGTLQRPLPCSVWWCGDAGDGTAFLCVDDLPPAASFAAMLHSPEGAMP